MSHSIRLSTAQYEALDSLNLSKLSKETGISRRQLIRIRKGETAKIHASTYQELNPYLSQACQQEQSKLMSQFLNDPNLEVMFKIIQDSDRIALNLHSAMVERRWGIVEVLGAILGLAVHYKNKAPHRQPIFNKRLVEVHWPQDLLLNDEELLISKVGYLSSRGQSERRNEVLWIVPIKIKTNGKTTRGRQPYQNVQGRRGASEHILAIPDNANPLTDVLSLDSKRLRQLLLGEEIAFKELLGLADVFGLRPENLFESNSTGKKYFFNVLKSKEYADYHVRLSKLRELMGLQP